MSKSRGIKAITVLVFVGLLAIGLSASSYAQNTFGHVLGTQQWKTFQNPNGAGGESATNIGGEHGKALRVDNSTGSVLRPCGNNGTPGRKPDFACW